MGCRPGPRVGLFFGRDALTKLTDNGAAIFDAAVRWATTTPPFVQYPRESTAAPIPGTSRSSTTTRVATARPITT